MVVCAPLGGRWAIMGIGSLHFFWVKMVVEKALEAHVEAGLRLCSGKPKVGAAGISACRACYGGTTGTWWPPVNGSAAFGGASDEARFQPSYLHGRCGLLERWARARGPAGLACAMNASVSSTTPSCDRKRASKKSWGVSDQDLSDPRRVDPHVQRIPDWAKRML